MNMKQKECRELEYKDYPERETASVIFRGEYPQIGRINTFLARWLESNHYEIIGEFFSIYHNSPKECKKPEEFVTELCVPILKKED